MPVPYAEPGQLAARYQTSLALLGTGATPSQKQAAKVLKKQVFLISNVFVPPNDVTEVVVEACGGGGGGGGGYGANTVTNGYGGGGGGGALKSTQTVNVTPQQISTVIVGAGGAGGAGGASGAHVGTPGSPGADSSFTSDLGTVLNFRGASGGFSADAVSETGLTGFGGNPTKANGLNSYAFVDTGTVSNILGSLGVMFSPPAAGGYSGGLNPGDHAGTGGDNPSGGLGGIGGTFGTNGAGPHPGAWGGGGGGGGAYPLGAPGTGGNGGNGNGAGAGTAGTAGTPATANSGGGGGGGGGGGVGSTVGGAGGAGAAGASGQVTVYYMSAF